MGYANSVSTLMNVRIRTPADRVLTVLTLRAVIAAIVLMVTMVMHAPHPDAPTLMSAPVRRAAVMPTVQMKLVALDVPVRKDLWATPWTHVQVFYHLIPE